MALVPLIVPVGVSELPKFGTAVMTGARRNHGMPGRSLDIEVNLFYVDAPLITQKFMIIAPVSAVPAAALLLQTFKLNDPAATVETMTSVFPPLEPDRIEATTASVTATEELVTVNSAAASAAKEAVFVVIAPVMVFKVTPVVLFVCCVTAPPAPASYPTPTAGEFEVILDPGESLLGPNCFGESKLICYKISQIPQMVLLLSCPAEVRTALELYFP
jgi:hypothetical protein